MDYTKKLPIRIQLSIIAFFIIIVMMFIILFSYSKTSNIIEQKNNEYFSQMIDQVNRTVVLNCDVLSRLVQNISYSKVVQNYLIETDPVKKYEQYEQIKDYLRNLSNIKDGIIDIVLLSNSGTTFNMNVQTDEIYAFKDEIPEKQLFYFTGMKEVDIYSTNKKCFIVGARIYSTLDFYTIDKELGTLLILIDVNSLVGYNDANTQNESQFFMIDRDGNVFFSHDSSIKRGTNKKDLPINIDKKFDTVNVNGTKYYITVGDIPSIGGKIVFKVTEDELLSGIGDVRRQQFVGFFIALLLLSVPFVFVISNILQPLKQFISFLNEIKKGKLKNLKKRVNLTGYAEINMMSDEFNNMLDEIDDLTHRLLESNSRLYELELAKSRSELEFLKSQVNPHFLYNTFESIKGMAVEEGSDNIFNMTKSLSSIFRYSIKGADIVTVDTELNMIKNYLFIQKIRFKNRINIDYSFNDYILQLKIPKMILQPIVENAIYHGLEPKVSGGELFIGGEIIKDKLIIYVKDNGQGINSDKLNILKSRLQNSSKFASNEEAMNTNIGFLNVNNRIKLNYGQEYGINIISDLNGTIVTINLPVQE